MPSIQDPASLPLEHKVALTSGGAFFATKAVADVPAIELNDGPHGLRKQRAVADHLGLHESVPATCYPPACGLSQSWNPDLVRRVGAALGRESLAESVNVLLGPAMNIKRSVLGGRNFEYVSEDPHVTGAYATSWVRGVQSEGVGTSPKHFAANNQENDRQRVSSDIDERPLREIYLRGFQRVVEDAQPWTIMTAYNRVNGVSASESTFLLNDVLRGEWGFDGVVVSDWAAVSDRVASALAGVDLDMPASGGVYDRRLVEAVHDGTLDESVVDRMARRVVQLVERTTTRPTGIAYDTSEHHELAVEAAEQSIVLLKNDDGLLPLAPGTRVAVVGAFAQTPRYQGGGSSRTNATQVDIPLDNLRAIGGDAAVGFAPGFIVDGDRDPVLEAEAIELARAAEATVLFIGLDESAESEAKDRTDIELPANQVALAHELARVTPNLVIVLAHGGVVRTTALPDVRALLDGALLGQGIGRAIARVVYGEVNPSGHLAETIPLRLQDTPAYLDFPGEFEHVRYGEGLHVGYRWYDAREMEVAFPFGHGLSYTTFDYRDLELTTDATGITVALTIVNTGGVAGRAVPQCYVSVPDSGVSRPPRELRGFDNVELQPGEAKRIRIVLRRADLEYWNRAVGRWVLESGEYEISVGESSRDLRLVASVPVEGDEPAFVATTRSTIGELVAMPGGAAFVAEAMRRMRQAGGGEEAAEVEEEVDRGYDSFAMVASFPISQFVHLSGGLLTPETIEEVVRGINEHADAPTESTEAASAAI